MALWSKPMTSSAMLTENTRSWSHSAPSTFRISNPTVKRMNLLKKRKNPYHKMNNCYKPFQVRVGISNNKRSPRNKKRLMPKFFTLSQRASWWLIQTGRDSTERSFLHRSKMCQKWVRQSWWQMTSKIPLLKQLGISLIQERWERYWPIISSGSSTLLCTRGTNWCWDGPITQLKQEILSSSEPRPHSAAVSCNGILTTRSRDARGLK